MHVITQFSTNVIMMTSVHFVQFSPQRCVWEVMNDAKIFLVILVTFHVECLVTKFFHVINTSVKRLAIKDLARQKVKPVTNPATK